jgi:NAD(P)H-dependent FMN reductase
MGETLKLHVVISSTRPNRVGLPVGSWFLERAKGHGKFSVELVDLKEINLPALDEPKHPRLRQYEHAHTKAWSATVAAADAFVFVTPEYNYGMAPALLNAFNYVYVEWNYKPAAFVSYGGLAGGTRSVQMAKMVATSLKMMPIPEAVNVTGVDKLIEGGSFKAAEVHDKGATVLLDELHRWAGALKTMRG